MADEEIKAKPKRVAVKEGDVFCAEFDNRFKCYFQNIIKDSTSLYGNVIRVFYKHYPAFMAGTLNVSELARVCGLSRPTVYKYFRILE